MEAMYKKSSVEELVINYVKRNYQIQGAWELAARVSSLDVTGDPEKRTSREKAGLKAWLEKISRKKVIIETLFWEVFA